MNLDALRTAATYVLALVVLLASFALIYQGRGDAGQAWLAVGTVLGYLFRDAGGASATNAVLRLQASAPTVTATSGPPATITSTPGPSA